MTSASAPNTVQIFYLKGTQFRVVHVDGAIGGITPRGFIHAAFYNERGAIPQMQTHNVSPDGQLSDPLSTEGKVGIVREVEFDVIMSRQAAADLRDWLTRTITSYDELELTQAKSP